jgi:hypothetical protein
MSYSPREKFKLNDWVYLKNWPSFNKEGWLSEATADGGKVVDTFSNSSMIEFKDIYIIFLNECLTKQDWSSNDGNTYF